MSNNSDIYLIVLESDEEFNYGGNSMILLI